MSTNKIGGTPDQAEPIVLSNTFQKALDLENKSSQPDLTLPWTTYVGPGTKTLKNLITKPKVEGVDLIALKHDLRYGLEPGILGEAKADALAIIENATTKPTSFVDALTKPLLTSGLLVKSAVWNFHPVNLISKLFSNTNSWYPPKDEIELVAKSKGMVLDI